MSETSLAEFKKKLESDPLLKAEFVGKFSSLLKEYNVVDRDIAAAASSEGGPGRVITSTRDTQKNESSFIVG